MKPVVSINESVNRFSKEGSCQQSDQLSIEEPLLIEIVTEKSTVRDEQAISLTVTMRTPGDDYELAAGFLFTEGIINDPSQIIRLEHRGENSGRHQLQNTLRATLSNDHELDMKRFQRNFYTHSSCGICGKTSIDALKMIRQPTLSKVGPIINSEQLMRLPELLRARQDQFQTTGAIHAAALFSYEGELISLREDIGRHNAVDKVIGALLLSKQPLPENTVLLVSGRVGFELVQKALMANTSFMASVGAPTSLALDSAEQFGMTLIGFLKENRFNIYHGDWRVR